MGGLLGFLGSIGGALIGRSSQRAANDTNLQVWREQQQ
ncbi:MAG: hypothetical protein [Microvirus sp.]|nr:MAG: hypothetical protein [Microvirus sp.]